MSTLSPAVEIDDLHVRFGEVEAVSGVSMVAYAGQATALLGRNGAGKSTTMRVLAGVVPPTAGEVRVAGHDVRRETLTVKRTVGYCPDVGGLVPRATRGSTCSCRPGYAGCPSGSRGRASCWSGSSSVTSRTG